MTHLVLVGPTASGKSTLAAEVANRLKGPAIELVSVDSMQVYRGMDIGTAKPTNAEQAERPHHLIDLADPHEEFSVTRFADAAGRAISAIEQRGHRALLVGGTGLYIQAVVGDLEPPPQYPDIRAELEGDEDTVALHRRLRELDEVAGGRMTPTNRRRIIRALEVTLGSGRPFSSFGAGVDSYPAAPRFRMAGVWLPRTVTAARIEQRFTAMLDAGLLDEVGRLARHQPVLSKTARQALGYKELLAHVEQKQPLDQCISEAVRRTRAFARRQRMWFRRDPRIHWFATPNNPVAVLPALLGEWSKCS